MMMHGDDICTCVQSLQQVLKLGMEIAEREGEISKRMRSPGNQLHDRYDDQHDDDDVQVVSLQWMFLKREVVRLHLCLLRPKHW